MRKVRAPRNRTLHLSDLEKDMLSSRLHRLQGPSSLDSLLDKTICQDTLEVLDYIPPESVDLVIIDPPYNLNKTFNGRKFKKVSTEEYEAWLNSWLSKIGTIAKNTASVYICGDWSSSGAIQRVAERYFIVRNRITWEREKGRGSKLAF